MNRGVWSIAAIGGLGLVAGLLLPGCEDEAGSKTPDVAVATAGSRGSKAVENKKKGEEFLAANAKKEGVKSLPSGLQYLVLQEGTGKQPGPTDDVEIHYHGTLVDGTVFDSSVERGQPMVHPVNGFIKGWQEALPMMKEGAKWRIFVPSNLAYGQRGFPPKIGPNSTLIFEIELLHVK